MPYSYADMDIELPDKEVYNLGEKIATSVSIKEDKNLNGFVKIFLVCDDYKMQYYTSPLSIEPDIRTQLSIPDLTFTSPMVGDCILKAAFDKDDGDGISSAKSTNFVVTDELNIGVNDILRTLPGESIVFSAKVTDANNISLQKGNAEIVFQKKNYEESILAGVMIHELFVDYSLDSGKYPLNIIVRDDNGNFGSEEVTLEVLQIPVRIENKMGEGKK